jgi:hypothetical protein
MIIRRSYGPDSTRERPHRLSQSVAAIRPRRAARCGAGSACRSRPAYSPSGRTRSPPPIGRRRQDEPAALQPLGVQRQPDAVVPQNLDQIAAAPLEDKTDRRRADRAPAPAAPAGSGRSLPRRMSVTPPASHPLPRRHRDRHRSSSTPSTRASAAASDLLPVGSRS